MKWSGVTWGVPVAPGSQLAGRVPAAAADETPAVAKPGATGNTGDASTAGGKASAPPQVHPSTCSRRSGSAPWRPAASRASRIS